VHSESKFYQYIKLHPITSIILGINTFMLVVVLLNGGFTIENLILYGGLLPSRVTEQGEYYRIILAMTLHGGLFHFLINSYVLYILGGHLERLIGPKRFGTLYLISGIVSSLFVVFFGESNIVTIGASGAIYGVMGGLFMLTHIKKEWFQPQTIQWLRNLIIINLILTFILPNISRLGHIGGLIAGLVLLYFMTPERPYFIDQYYKDHNIIEVEANDSNDVYQ